MSTRISKRRCERRNERLTCTPSSGMIPHGSGDHHPSGPGPSGPRPCRRIGNRPWRYAARSVPGARSAPTPAISTPSTICAGDGSSQRVGGGSDGTARTLPNRSDLRLRASRGPICDRRHRPSLAWRDAAGPSNGFARACCRAARGALHHCWRRARTVRTHADRVEQRNRSPRASRRVVEQVLLHARPRAVARRRHRGQRTTPRRGSPTRPRKRVTRHARGARRVHDVGDAALDTGRRRRHARHPARRAHLIDRVNTHDQDVYAKLEKATPRAAQAATRAEGRHPRCAGRRARRAQVTGRGDRRQARPGRGAGAGADRGGPGRGVEGRRDHDDGGARGAARHGCAHDHHHAGAGTRRAGRLRPTTRARPARTPTTTTRSSPAYAPARAAATTAS